MKQFVLSISLLMGIFLTQNSFIKLESPVSRGKQQKIFPKILKQQKIYLGISEEKFLKKLKFKKKNDSLETKTYNQTFNKGIIQTITYNFTKENIPKLYQITLIYKDLNMVIPESYKLLGKPNYNNEWRFIGKQMREKFDIGVWSFGQKLVYAATLKGSAWEQGF